MLSEPKLCRWLQSSIPLLLLVFSLPVSGLLVGCRREEPEQELYRRIDLLTNLPHLAGNPEQLARKVQVHLGTLVVPHRAALKAPGEVRGIAQDVGSRLQVAVHVGAEAWLEFQPLDQYHPCDCVFRVSMVDGDHDTVLGEVDSPGKTLFGPPMSTILLPAAGGPRDVVLNLDVVPRHFGGRRAIWGSPAIVTSVDPASRRKQAAAELRTPHKPHILLIGIDTQRADRLGAWGREPSITPSLDHLAGQSDVWRRAYTVVNSTNPSFTSMFTGLYCKDHGIYDLETRVVDEVTTLPERLEDLGYATLGVFSVRHLAGSGLTQGFDVSYGARSIFAGQMAVDLAMDWLDATARDGRSTFTFLHLFDPHTPHTPPEPFSLGMAPFRDYGLGLVGGFQAFRDVGPVEYTTEHGGGGAVELYDGAVAYVDYQIGRLIGFLKERGLWDSTLIVVVGDHGENLFEHGVEIDHVGLWEATTHVPLIVHWPGQEQGRRLDGLVETIDLFPTLLSAAGGSIPDQDGMTLQDLEQRGGRDVVFAEHANHHGLSLRDARYRYVSHPTWRNTAPGPYLFDTVSDPQELHNVLQEQPEVARRLAAAADAWSSTRRKAPRLEQRKLEPSERELLEALGYLESSGGG